MLRRVLVPTPTGAQIPLSQLADLEIRKGPPSIKSENARLNAWIYIDLEGRRRREVGQPGQGDPVDASSSFRPGIASIWSGQYEYMERAAQRLQSGRADRARNHLPAPLPQLPKALGHLDRDAVAPVRADRRRLAPLAAGLRTLSVAVGVGFIALAGVSAELGVILLVFLEEAVSRFQREDRLHTRADLYAAVREGRRAPRTARS